MPPYIKRWRLNFPSGLPESRFAEFRGIPKILGTNPAYLAVVHFKAELAASIYSIN